MDLDLRALADFDRPVSLAKTLVHFGARLKLAHAALNELKATGRASVTITPDDIVEAATEIEALGCMAHIRYSGGRAR